MQNATLTARQRRFVDEYMVDGVGAAAAVRAGFAPGSAKVTACRYLTSDNPVSRAIKARQEADSVRLRVSRDDVIRGLQEAFEMAKSNQSASEMTAAARELGRLQGYYAPDRSVARVDLSGGVTAKRFEAMSDAELMAIIEAQNGATEA